MEEGGPLIQGNISVMSSKSVNGFKIGRELRGHLVLPPAQAKSASSYQGTSEQLWLHRGWHQPQSTLPVPGAAEAHS